MTTVTNKTMIRKDTKATATIDSLNAISNFVCSASIVAFVPVAATVVAVVFAAAVVAVAAF